MRSNKGYGVLEIVIVVVIAGVLAALTIPGLSAIRRSYQVTTAADQLAAEIQTARLLAVARNAPFQVRFNTAEGSYQVIDPEDPTNPPRAIKTLPTGVTFQTVPGAPLTFSARGNSPGGAIVIGNEKLTLRVLVSTSGAVKVTNPEIVKVVP